VPFILGVANSGKSTIADIAASFYASHNVGSIPGTLEKVFGLLPLSRKMLAICYEVTQSLSISRADFQSIVSGETLQLAEKNKMAQTVKWDTPLFLVGNEIFGMQDTQGSLSRRIVFIEFNKKVPLEKTDTTLKAKLAKELPNIILKTNMAYAALRSRCGTEGIWKVLPASFLRSQKRMAALTNPINAFLNDRTVIERKDDAFEGLAILKKRFKAYLTNNRIRYSFEDMQFRQALKDEGYNIVFNKVYEVDNVQVKGAVVMGMTYVADRGDDAFNDDFKDYEEESLARAKLQRTAFFSDIPVESGASDVIAFFNSLTIVTKIDIK
jgi:hypothetical protein